MDSLEWSRKYDIFSISRLYLVNQLGFSPESIHTLTEAQMQEIADMVHDALLVFSKIHFEDEVRDATSIVLAQEGDTDETPPRTA